MRSIYAAIHRGGRALAEHPLFHDWLEREDVPAAEKLLFAPAAIDYVMGFRDFCRYYVAYPPPVGAAARDPYEEALTVHAEEDASHSALFVEDWGPLAIDTHFGLTGRGLLAFMNGPETSRARAADYALCRLAAAAQDPKLRFPLIEAMEVAGQVFFRRTVPVVDALVAAGALATPLRYFGRHHLDREDGHLQHADETIFFGLSFDDGERAQALRLVEAVFAVFREHFDLWLAFLRRPRPLPAAPPASPLALPESAALPRPPTLSAHPLRRPLPGRAEAALQAALDRLAAHPAHAALAATPPHDALATILRTHVVDAWAWADFFLLDLGAPALPAAVRSALAPAPPHPAVVALAATIAREGAAVAEDYAALGVESTGQEALRHYWLDPIVETHRAAFAALRRRTFALPEGPARAALLVALYRIGDPLRGTVAALLGERAKGRFLPLRGEGATLHDAPFDGVLDDLLAPLADAPVDVETLEILEAGERARLDGLLASLPLARA